MSKTPAADRLLNQIGYTRPAGQDQAPHPAESDAVRKNNALTSANDSSDGSDIDSDDALLDGVRDGTWLDTQHFAPLTYAVPGLIPEGLTILIGPPKAGKSWLTLDLLLGVAAGGVALGQIRTGQPRRVLYLALEDGDRRMQDRCRALLGSDYRPADPIPPLFCYKTTIKPGTVLATIAAWMRRHPDTALVVIDTLGKVMPPAWQGESAYQRDYRIGSALKDQADSSPGLAVVVLHHDRKAGSDDFVDSVSGTHGLAGAADTIAVLCRARNSDEGSLKVTGRDVPENEYALTFRQMAWQLDGADLTAAASTAKRREDAKSMSDTSAQIVDFVRQRPAGVKAKEVADRFGKDAYQYLKRQAEAGRLEKKARGLYVVPESVSEPSEASEAQDSGGADSDIPWRDDGIPAIGDGAEATCLAPGQVDANLRRAGEDSARDAESHAAYRAYSDYRAKAANRPRTVQEMLSDPSLPPAAAQWLKQFGDAPPGGHETASSAESNGEPHD